MASLQHTNDSGSRSRINLYKMQSCKFICTTQAQAPLNTGKCCGAIKQTGKIRTMNVAALIPELEFGRAKKKKSVLRASELFKIMII